METILPDEFYALCIQVGDRITVRKFSFDQLTWYSVPVTNWPIEQHPEVDRYIKNKKSLSDKGRRTAAVKLVSGRKRDKTKAAELYVNENLQFKVGDIILKKESDSDKLANLERTEQIDDVDDHSLTAETLLSVLSE